MVPEVITRFPRSKYDLHLAGVLAKIFCRYKKNSTPITISVFIHQVFLLEKSLIVILISGFSPKPWVLHDWHLSLRKLRLVRWN